MLEDKFYDDGRASFEELIAEGEYESQKETILAGFKIFQKKYAYKNVVIQMIVVIIALFSQITAIISAPEGTDVSFSYLLVLVCVILGCYILFRPRNAFKKLKSSIDELQGCRYKAEIYTNKIVITTLYDPYINEQEEKSEVEKESSDEGQENDTENEEDDLPPATVIHTDNSTVEIVDCPEMYVVYIKNYNVFIIPKSAFKPYDVGQVKDRLSNIMGVRYKAG